MSAFDPATALETLATEYAARAAAIRRDLARSHSPDFAEQAVQLHGAMGVTEELDIGAYFKRLLAFDTLFGGSAHHYRRHAALSGRAHA